VTDCRPYEDLPHCYSEWEDAELRAYSRADPLAWGVYMSRRVGDGTWIPAAHHRYLAERVLRMVGESDRVRSGKPVSMEPGALRLAVSLPPGAGKSECLCVVIGSWLKATRPSDRVVIASYAKSLALIHSVRARDALAELGPECFGVSVNKRDAAELWYVRDLDTGRRYDPGFFFAVGRQGGFTGKRADWFFFDDLVKDKDEAKSAPVLESAWGWLDSVGMTRLLPHSAAIGIGTRWASLDPIGRLEKKQESGEVELPWEFVNLPALCDKVPDPLGREIGESLWPWMWSAERLESIRRGRDAYTWNALYQGRPIPEGGALFQKDHFSYFVEDGEKLLIQGGSVPVANLARFATVDLAYSTKTSADFTVAAVWGADMVGGGLYLLHLERERVPIGELGHWLRRVFSEHQIRRAFVERSGFYADVTKTLIADGLPLREIQPNTDKVDRAGPALAMLASGHMHFRSGAPWLDDLEAELLAFPKGANDDQVDAISYGAWAMRKFGRRRRRASSSQPNRGEVRRRIRRAY